MRIMLSDNKDSFTYNIVHLLRSMDVEVDVFDNSTSVEGLETGIYDGLIISPGPGNPLNEQDRENGFDLLALDNFPAVLGICFGHQLIGNYLGCDIYRTQKLFHGEIDTIRRTGDGLLSGLPEEFSAVRYHSLAVRPCSGIQVDAVSASDGSVMAFHSPDGRYYGLQFHPESYYSEFGDRILMNFLGVINERSGRDIRQESR